MIKGFKEFLMRGNVIDLAVAVVIGVAFTALVNSLVKDIITPLIAAIAGQHDFSDLSSRFTTARSGTATSSTR
jgi:large conductance mechanosensitive channel